MSAHIEAKIEIRDMRILKDTLEKMNFKFTENGNIVSVKAGYRNINFDLDNQKVNHDSYETKTANSIKAQYAFNYKKNELSQIGATFDVVENENNIEIYVK